MNFVSSMGNQENIAKLKELSIKAVSTSKMFVL